MDGDSDNNAGFEVGRRRPSLTSSRESSPVTKRQKRSFTPTSDDDDLVVPVHAHNEDTETPTPENAPLIRQAVGFSWTPSTSANVSTYQATVASEPAAPCFLPGQAPLPPSKPKPSKPRAPRKKKGLQYSAQTSKFKLNYSSSSPASGSATLVAPSPGNSADTTPSSAPANSTTQSSSMPPLTSASYVFMAANGDATAGTGNTDGTTAGVASDAVPPTSKRTGKSSKRKAPRSIDDSFGRQSARPPPGPPTPITTCVAPQYSASVNSGASPVQRSLQASVPQRAVGSTSASTTAIRDSALRPVRMVTLLIEDMRSGVPDPQLAEVKVPLKIADDPEDGFWADAADICDALQNGPSRIDGPAKVYTMRGRFRQFFMRVDRFDQLQVQSAHIGVTKERTINVFVEAPVPQGYLPRPPAPPLDARPSLNSNSEREVMASHAEAPSRREYSLVTREDQIERLSKSSYAITQSRRYSPASESGSYGHSQRTPSPHRHSRRDQYTGPSQRYLTPPIPGRPADTQEEKDEAIANYIRSHIENHPGWMEYMQSKAKPQRVSEILKQYTFVDDRVRELIGRKTPAHWDGAPNSYVEKHHVWRVLNLDPGWGEACQETSLLVSFYGKNGTRCEDSRIIEMINDTSPPKANTMDRFVRLLRSVDEDYTQDALRGQFVPIPGQN